jgi:hypothetical protein
VNWCKQNQSFRWNICWSYTCDDDNDDDNAAADNGDEDGSCGIPSLGFFNKRYCAKRTYLSEKSKCYVYIACAFFLVSDKYVLVSIEQLNPTEYGTFYVPYSAEKCHIRLLFKIW